MSWFRRGTEDEDRMLAEAGAVILNTVGDADKVATIQGATGKSLRDQLSVAEAEEMAEETRLRGWGWRRN